MEFLCHGLATKTTVARSRRQLGYLCKMSLSFFSKTLVRPLQPLFNIQTAEFSKYISKSRTKRLPLTTKRVAKGYNKGNGARKEGVLDSKGKCKVFYA
jgi:hypothetical protein